MGGEFGIPHAIIWALDKRQRRSPEEGALLDKPIRRSPLLHKEGAFFHGFRYRVPMVRIAFDGFARKGEIRAREAPVPGLRQDVLGNHRNGIPLAEDARGQAEDDDKPHAQRHKAEGHNRLRGAFLEDHVSVEDEGLRRRLRNPEKRDALWGRVDRREIGPREREHGREAAQREEDEGRLEEPGLRRMRRGVERGEIRRGRREGAHNVGRMRQDLWGPHSQGIEDRP